MDLKPIKGKRLPDGSPWGEGKEGPPLASFWRQEVEGRLVWHCKIPIKGWVGNLDNHEVEEHEDGTITVSPSILITTGDGRQWHGYLEHGVWRPLDDCILEIEGVED